MTVSEIATIAIVGSLIVAVIAVIANLFATKDVLKAGSTFVDRIEKILSNPETLQRLQSGVQSWPAERREAALAALEVLNPLTKATVNDIDDRVAGFLNDIFSPPKPENEVEDSVTVTVVDVENKTVEVSVSNDNSTEENNAETENVSEILG
jgi:hypothetical protein